MFSASLFKTLKYIKHKNLAFLFFDNLQVSEIQTESEHSEVVQGFLKAAKLDWFWQTLSKQFVVCH